MADISVTIEGEEKVVSYHKTSVANGTLYTGRVVLDKEIIPFTINVEGSGKCTFGNSAYLSTEKLNMIKQAIDEDEAANTEGGFFS